MGDGYGIHPDLADAEAGRSGDDVVMATAASSEVIPQSISCTRHSRALQHPTSPGWGGLGGGGGRTRA